MHRRCRRVARRSLPTLTSFSCLAAHCVRAASLGGAAASRALRRWATSAMDFLLRVLLSSLKAWLQLISLPVLSTCEYMQSTGKCKLQKVGVQGTISCSGQCNRTQNLLGTLRYCYTVQSTFSSKALAAAALACILSSKDCTVRQALVRRSS